MEKRKLLLDFFSPLVSMYLITLTLLIPKETNSATDIIERKQICGGVAGVLCSEGYFCEYPTPNYPDAQGTCQKKIPKTLIQYGDFLWSSGNPQAAIRYYNEAYILISQTGDPYELLTLTARYLGLRHEQAAMDSYAKAISSANYMISRDPRHGEMHAYGLKALQDLVNYHSSTIRTIAASQKTQEWFRSRTAEVNKIIAAQTMPSPKPQPIPSKPREVPGPLPLDPSGHPLGIFCPPETMLLRGECVPNRDLPSGPLSGK